MNSKERMLNLFKGGEVDCIPAAPHWWGMYKFQLAGLTSGYENESKCWDLQGAALADVDTLFYETFRPDSFHLNSGSWRYHDKARADRYWELRTRLKALESKSFIDEYIGVMYAKADEVIKSGTYDHVKILSEKYRESVFITMNEGNPVCDILDPQGPFGFEEGLIALVEKPEMMEYLFFREYEMYLERMKALKVCGCHGYIGSETYCSTDLISPSTYRDVIFPAHKYFYEKVREIGLVPIVYFLGEIIPLMDYINRMGVTALLVEEPKKGYSLDVVEIRKKLNEEITLFGNLDSVYTMLYGNSNDVRNETLNQLEASKYGRFVMANGCPIAFNTPKDNILAMIETAHSTAGGRA